LAELASDGRNVRDQQERSIRGVMASWQDQAARVFNPAAMAVPASAIAAIAQKALPPAAA
jgi:hypothetical protein